MKCNNYYYEKEDKLIFIDFLDRYRVKDKFFTNLENNCLQELAQPREWINFAFDWDNTPEGHNFWFDLNQKWIKELTKYKKVEFGDETS